MFFNLFEPFFAIERIDNVFFYIAFHGLVVEEDRYLGMSKKWVLLTRTKMAGSGDARKALAFQSFDDEG